MPARNALPSWNSAAAPGQFVNACYEATTYEKPMHTPKTPERRQLRQPRRFRRLPDRILQPQHCHSNGDYDFCVFGNPVRWKFQPGIVYVMQDENGDGLPQRYVVRSERQRNGQTRNDPGLRDHLLPFRKIRYPLVGQTRETTAAWALSITELRPCIRNGSGRTATYAPRNAPEPRTVQEGGIWKNKSFDWGYVDNYSTTDPHNNKESRTQQTATGNRIRISDAVTPNGQPANLKYRLYQGAYGFECFGRRTGRKLDRGIRLRISQSGSRDSIILTTLNHEKYTENIFLRLALAGLILAGCSKGRAISPERTTTSYRSK